MKTDPKYIIPIILFISFICTYDRCTKIVPLPPCSVDCNDAVFAGTVTNAAYNTPISNAQIQINTYGGNTGPYDTDFVVGTVKSDASGNLD
jgi:hypothetical protein